jgi:hypothetical protein
MEIKITSCEVTITEDEFLRILHHSVPDLAAEKYKEATKRNFYQDALNNYKNEDSHLKLFKIQ